MSDASSRRTTGALPDQAAESTFAAQECKCPGDRRRVRAPRARGFPPLWVGDIGTAQRDGSNTNAAARRRIQLRITPLKLRANLEQTLDCTEQGRNIVAHICRVAQLARDKQQPAIGQRAALSGESHCFDWWNEGTGALPGRTECGLCAQTVTSPSQQRYLTSVNSSMPRCDPSRPSPLCLIPPNGATSFEINPQFIPTMPASTLAA